MSNKPLWYKNAPLKRIEDYNKTLPVLEVYTFSTK